MNDLITSIFAHATNSLQAYGFSPSGAKQMANGCKPANPVDQAMLKAYDNKANGTNKTGTTSNEQKHRPPPIDLNP